MENVLLKGVDFLKVYLANCQTDLPSVLNGVFWNVILLLCLIASYNSGMYHVLITQLLGFLVCMCGYYDYSTSVVYDVILAASGLVIVEFLFLDRVKYCRPLYLALSNKMMVCAGSSPNFLKSLPSMKHWAITVPTGKPGYFYLYHARGKVLTQLQGACEIVPVDHLRSKRTLYGFYRIGLTSKECLVVFARNRTLLNQCYTYYVQMCLSYPYNTSISVFGRLEYYIMIATLCLTMVYNHLFGRYLFTIDASLVYFIMFFYDYFTEFMSPSGSGVRRSFSSEYKSSRTSTRWMIVTPILFLLICYVHVFHPWLKFNGYFSVCLIMADIIVVMILRCYQEPFDKYIESSPDLTEEELGGAEDFEFCKNLFGSSYLGLDTTKVFSSFVKSQEKEKESEKIE